MRGPRNDVVLVGGAGEIGGLFQGAMVSIIILIPDTALSISPCTREISEFRNVCRFWSSDVAPAVHRLKLNLTGRWRFVIVQRYLDLRGEFWPRLLYQIGDCLSHLTAQDEPSKKRVISGCRRC